MSLRTQPPERATPPALIHHAQAQLPAHHPEPYIASAAVNHVATAALALQLGDHVGATTAARQAIRAAENPVRALLAAAALIDVDRPMKRWWDPVGRGAWRCGWCDRSVGGRRGSRRYCTPECFTASRRAYWRARGRAAREAGRVVDAGCAVEAVS